MIGQVNRVGEGEGGRVSIGTKYEILLGTNCCVNITFNKHF